MKTRSGYKPKKTDKSSPGQASSQKNSRQASGPTDNRPESAVQRKLQEITQNSAQVKQLSSVQQMANAYSMQKNTRVTKESSRNHSGETAQLMAVAQLATRLSSPVQFNGGAYQLEQLIRQWGPPNGTNVQVIQTDHVGGTYQVRFTNNNGPAISLQQANQWVQAGIAHYVEDDSSSSSDEESSEGSGEDSN